MEKDKAVASLGQVALLLPAWITAALKANDRLKLYLSVLQSAAAHATNPTEPGPDWSKELRRMGMLEPGWLQEITPEAHLEHDELLIPHFETLLDALIDDLTTMARPLCETGEKTTAGKLLERRDFWLERLRAIKNPGAFNLTILSELTHGTRSRGDSLHLLVMDLHKELNALSSRVATENLDGAHVWNVNDRDRPLIQAFMRGLNRTESLKFNHPGLETTVTREGDKLLIQNDIGTNDAHVLVIEVSGRTIRLTYSDLHPPRFDFFKSLLEKAGFEWTVLEPQTTTNLNQGQPYTVGYGVFKAKSPTALLNCLETAASRIVFVIDWNRARKRLQKFVRKPVAEAILLHTAESEVGHMGWLIAGGERLVFNAMMAVGNEAFRIGDRLDEIIGETAAQHFLQLLMTEASVKLRQQLPIALVADEARILLARILRQRSHEFDLLAEHVALGHAIGLILSEALHNYDNLTPESLTGLGQQAKSLERKADHLLMTARERAARSARWIPMLNLLEQMDDVADSLEEGLFTLTLIRSGPFDGLPPSVQKVLSRLCDATLAAIQDQVKAVEIARQMSDSGSAEDQEAFLQALWRTLKAERHCDELHRAARCEIVQKLGHQGSLFCLANELSVTIEQATDKLLAAGFAMRDHMFRPSGTPQ